MQKLQKNRKNGFTLVELSIVIAVIAILIAVLVPTFIALINKANESADQQTVKNLNTALTIDEAGGEKPEYLCEVWDIFKEAGYNPAPTPSKSGTSFCWYTTVNRVVIVEDNKITFPATYEGYTVSTADTGNVKLAAAVVAESTVSSTELIALDTDEDSDLAHNYENGACTICGHEKPCDHEYTQTAVTKSNVTFEGSKAVYSFYTETTYTCSICGHTYTETTAVDETQSATMSSAYTELYTYDENLVLTTFNSSNYNLGSESGSSALYIPEGTTAIGDGVFSQCENLESVTIPDSVTTIGKNAFNYCSSLTSVDIPDSVTSIGDNAFSSCGLTSVVIPDSVVTIGNGAFSSCMSLKSVTIGKNVKSIGDSAFNFCALESVVIPASVEKIGKEAFSDIGNPLKSITFEITEGWYYTSSSDYTGGTSIDLSNPTTNLNYFDVVHDASGYYNCYWYRTVTE